MNNDDVKAGERATGGSARRQELLRRTLDYAAEHSLSGLSLRPLAKAIGSSPRVLLYLFGSKSGLIREVLALNRALQLDLLRDATESAAGPRETFERLWAWLIHPARANVRRLFFEAYTQSAGNHDEAWRGFAEQSVNDWLAPLRSLARNDSVLPEAKAEATLVLAVMRGLFLDLLATDDHERVTAAWQAFLAAHYPQASPNRPRGSASGHRTGR
ncbi:MAG TPA: TetR/AcrR family transcriptional regulator [Pilimelia sp.]|nr:TetR/AcrR family transcriptional regulator [Pilimelia sp.]